MCCQCEEVSSESSFLCEPGMTVLVRSCRAGELGVSPRRGLQHCRRKLEAGILPPGRIAGIH